MCQLDVEAYTIKYKMELQNINRKLLPSLIILYSCLILRGFRVNANAIEDFIKKEISRQLQLSEKQMKQEMLTNMEMKVEKLLQKKVTEALEASNQGSSTFGI